MMVSFSCRPEVISYVGRGLQTHSHVTPFNLVSRSHNENDSLPFTSTLKCLNRHGQNFCGGVERNFHGGVHSGDQFVFGVGNIYFGVHGPRSHIDLIGEADNFPFKGAVHARHIDGDRLANLDIGNRSFGNGNHEAQQAILRQDGKGRSRLYSRKFPLEATPPCRHKSA